MSDAKGVDDLSEALSKVSLSPGLILSEPPAGSAIAKKMITLATLVDKGYLKVGANITTSVNGVSHKAVIVKGKDGRYAFCEPSSNTIGLNPYQLLVKLYGKERAQGRSWQCLRLNDGRTLKEVKETYIQEMIKEELMQIPDVFQAYLTLIDKDGKKFPGFVVCLASGSDISKLRGEYEILNAHNVQVVIKDKPLPESAPFQYGCKIGKLPGTLGCFCKDQNDQHYAVTANHVLDGKDCEVHVNDEMSLSSYKRILSHDVALLKVDSGTPHCYIPNLACLVDVDLYFSQFGSHTTTSVEIDHNDDAPSDAEISETSEPTDDFEVETAVSDQMQSDANVARPTDPSSIGFNELQKYIDRCLESNITIPVFKRGYVTGLTAGILRNVKASFRLSTGSKITCGVLVDWTRSKNEIYAHTDPTDPAAPTDPTYPAAPTNPADPTDPAAPTNPADPTDPAAPTYPLNSFTQGGDSGALYYIEWTNRNVFYGLVPIAIHLEGNKGYSVGCRISEAFEVLRDTDGILQFCDAKCSTTHPLPSIPNKTTHLSTNNILYYSTLPSNLSERR